MNYQVKCRAPGLICSGCLQSASALYDGRCLICCELSPGSGLDAVTRDHLRGFIGRAGPYSNGSVASLPRVVMTRRAGGAPGRSPDLPPVPAPRAAFGMVENLVVAIALTLVVCIAITLWG